MYKLQSSKAGSRAIGTEFALCFFVLISGCAFPAGVFNEAGLARDQLAMVGTHESFVELVQVTAVFDVKGRRVIGTDSMTAQSRWKQLELQPGDYQIVAYCVFSLGRASAHPRTNVRLDAGKRYQLACEIIEEEGIPGKRGPARAKLVLREQT